MVKPSRTTRFNAHTSPRRNSRKFRRAVTKDSIHQPPIIYIDYNPAPTELSGTLPNNADSAIKIVYEELAPPDIIEIHHNQTRAPLQIPTFTDNANEPLTVESLNNDASLSFELLNELEQETSSPSHIINKVLSWNTSTIEYSPSYSPLPSPLLTTQEDDNDSTGEITEGMLNYISDPQLLNLLGEIDWTFLDEANM